MTTRLTARFWNVRELTGTNRPSIERLRLALETAHKGAPGIIGLTAVNFAAHPHLKAFADEHDFSLIAPPLSLYTDDGRKPAPHSIMLVRDHLAPRNRNAYLSWGRKTDSGNSVAWSSAVSATICAGDTNITVATAYTPVEKKTSQVAHSGVIEYLLREARGNDGNIIVGGDWNYWDEMFECAGTSNFPAKTGDWREVPPEREMKTYSFSPTNNSERRIDRAFTRLHVPALSTCTIEEPPTYAIKGLKLQPISDHALLHCEISINPDASDLQPD